MKQNPSLAFSQLISEVCNNQLMMKRLICKVKVYEKDKVKKQLKLGNMISQLQLKDNVDDLEFSSFSNSNEFTS